MDYLAKVEEEIENGGRRRETSETGGEEKPLFVGLVEEPKCLKKYLDVWKQSNGSSCQNIMVRWFYLDDDVYRLLEWWNG